MALTELLLEADSKLIEFAPQGNLKVALQRAELAFDKSCIFKNLVGIRTVVATFEHLEAGLKGLGKVLNKRLLLRKTLSSILVISYAHLKHQQIMIGLH